MSGDIGRGATRESIAFARRLALANEKPPGTLVCFVCVHVLSIIL